MTSMKRAVWARPLLAAVITVAPITVVTPGTGYAAAPPLRTAAVAVAGPATYEEKLAVAVKFGLVDDFALLELADRDFVIEIWKHLKDQPEHAEVRLAAEAAFGALPDEAADACHAFITAGVFAAFDRDVAREQRTADARRERDLARTTAAASIDVVAGPALLDGSDTDFVRLIWERVVEDADWPGVKAAARTALDGDDADRAAFIASGMAAAARQDIENRIAADDARTEAEKAAERARAAKKLAANRIGLPVTDELLDLPDRDFIIEIWNGADAYPEVQAAAITAVRSSDPAVWTAFINTGLHAAKDRDIDNAAQRQEAEDRRLANGVLDRATAAGWKQLAAAARAALAGDAAAVSRFLLTGQYEVAADVTQMVVTNTRVGLLTASGHAYVNEGGLHAPWVHQYANVKQLVLSGNRIGVVTRAGVALVKEGALTAPFVQQRINVKQLALAGNRIGVLLTDGTVTVREGGLTAAWDQQRTGARELVLNGDRIGVVLTGNQAYVKEGTLASNTWVLQHSNVRRLVLASTEDFERIGILRGDNVFQYKDGALNGAFAHTTAGISEVAMTGPRIATLVADGSGTVRSDLGGTIPPHTARIVAGSTRVSLDTGRICYVGGDGLGYCNNGGLGAVFEAYPTPAV
ncbi:hypothetical protein OHA21_31180 [Actinoplanes sp. NBC_00393]|uniref:ALF repeat-containing protein n=1 Tax=Actinoplanes sp. NBC_00393 TaxID=2975953 RepID=UPI002E242871